MNRPCEVAAIEDDATPTNRVFDLADSDIRV